MCFTCLPLPISLFSVRPNDEEEFANLTAEPSRTAIEESRERAGKWGEEPKKLGRRGEYNVDMKPPSADSLDSRVKGEDQNH